MFVNKFTLKLVTTFVVAIALASCSDDEVVSQVNEPERAMAQAVELAVYKSPSCGCCKKWLSHINENGFESTVHSFDDFPAIKEKQAIAPRYRSCHTAISHHGYVFEGHVPAKFIHQFMHQSMQGKHTDDVIGLSVPAMPVGSPGMEVGDKFQPYRILLLKSDGSYEIYANVQSYEEQF